MGRLVNHSRLLPNLKARALLDEAGEPRVVLFAARDIQAGEELMFDYGDNDPASIEAHPWLRT